MVDDLLTTLEPSEPAGKANRGQLKIFLGYCAGVGKTYRMLHEGIINRASGVDVVVGLVETHGRVDTEALVGKLELLPRKVVQYSGMEFTEMDLDGILKRNPRLVLVDELAHTNLPGSRHAKRYQDVEELLNAGINVYSTLNIQHVQGLIDIVYQITGVRIEEIIPNWFLDGADEIELVDLSPEKLQQRLVEGKVYIPQKAQLAMQRFFKKGNLLALRELSLKYTAQWVDTDLLSYRESEEILDVWPVNSKLLVGISSNKNSERVLLITHRMATDLNAEWYAVHVESLQQVRYTDKARNQLYRNINLAEELGAKVITLSGTNIADEIVKFSQQKNVTLILTGLSQRSRWQEFTRGSVLNELVKKASPINVLVVGGNQRSSSQDQLAPQKTSQLGLYWIGLGSIATIFGLSWFLPHWISADNLLMVLLLPAIVLGILGDGLVGVVTAVIAAIGYDFIFIEPTASLAIADLRHLSNMVIMILIVAGVSWVGRMIRWRADSAGYREKFIYALYNFSREIIGANSSEELLNRAIRSIGEAFETDAIILVGNSEGKELGTEVASNPDLKLSDAEQAIAVWVFKNGCHAGKGTSTLSSTKWYYLPLKFQEQVYGVICLIKPQENDNFSPEQKRLLEAFCGVIALSLAKTVR